MKTCSFILVLSLLLSAPAWGQFPTKVLENTYRLPAGKRVDLQLKFASGIKVGVWNRNELGLKTILTLSDSNLEKVHTMTVREGEGSLNIATDYDFGPNKDRWNNCWNCNDPGNPNAVCLKVSYELMLPPDADLSLETISGDIEIRGLRGPIRAKSISGFVDLGLDPRTASNLSFKCVTGEIYTDFDVSLDGKSTAYSKRLSQPLNGGGVRIDLETVSGDIFFRKM